MKVMEFTSSTNLYMGQIGKGKMETYQVNLNTAIEEREIITISFIMHHLKLVFVRLIHMDGLRLLYRVFQ